MTHIPKLSYLLTNILELNNKLSNFTFVSKQDKVTEFYSKLIPSPPPPPFPLLTPRQSKNENLIIVTLAVGRNDETSVDADKNLLHDLETLNQQLASGLNGRNTQFLFTGDTLFGKNHCAMGDLVDCLYECWRSDPAHRDKSTYLRLAMVLLDFLEPKLDPNDPPLPARSDAGRPALALVEALLLRVSRGAGMTARMTGLRRATDTALARPTPTNRVASASPAATAAAAASEAFLCRSQKSDLSSVSPLLVVVVPFFF